MLAPVRRLSTVAPTVYREPKRNAVVSEPSPSRTASNGQNKFAYFFLLELVRNSSTRGRMTQLSQATRRTVNLTTHSSTLPFSDGILVGDTLYLSGRLGIDPVTGRVPADIDAEIKLLFDGFEAVLQQAGMTM